MTSMHSTRKRRAASLTAEALWTIQMNEGTNPRTASQTAKDSSASNSQGNTNTSSRKRRRKSTQLHSGKHQNHIAQTSTSNVPNKRKCIEAEKKSKPTASVIPVKKNVSATEWPTSSNISIALDNSHLLLLPVSVNNVPLSSVPVLTIHPSMNLKLVNCFGTSSSPVVNVRSLFQQRNSDSMKHLPHINRSSDSKPVPILPRSGSHCVGNNSGDSQTEPLNLKLGESTIPSHKSAKISLKAAPKVLNVLRKGTAKEFPLKKTPGKLQTKIMPRALGETFDTAYSPSSESSYSSEPDATTTSGRRSRKRSINLRSKAAQSDEEQSSRRQSQSNAENNAWTWEGKPYYAMVYSVKSGRPVKRRCYPSMRRRSDNPKSSVSSDTDDVVVVRDCVVMRAHMSEQPYIAKVVALWEETSGNMMISLLWFYRPEHTEDPKVASRAYSPSELFASRHLDEISVACVEEKGYVLTYNEYCRYRASDCSREDHTGADDGRQIVPALSTKARRHTVPADIDCSLVYFCRRYYDIKSNRLLKQFPNPTALYLRDDKFTNDSTVKSNKS